MPTPSHLVVYLLLGALPAAIVWLNLKKSDELANMTPEERRHDEAESDRDMQTW
jgi:hypothetical protein